METEQIQARKVAAGIPVIDLRLANMVHDLQDGKQDAVVCVGGMEGTGKSTLAEEVCATVDPDFLIERNVYSNESFRYYLNTLAKPSAICVDEAVLTSWNQDWAQKQQKRTNKLLTLNRNKRHFSVLVIPSIFELNPRLRNHRVSIYIYVPYRGLAMVYLKPPIAGLKDPWKQKQWEGVGDWWKPEYSKDALVERLRKIRGYTYEFRFPPLPPDVEAVYQARRTAGLQEDEDDLEGSKDRDAKWLGVIYGLVSILEDLGQPAEKIAAALSVPADTLRSWLMQASESAKQQKNQ